MPDYKVARLLFYLVIFLLFARYAFSVGVFTDYFQQDTPAFCAMSGDYLSFPDINNDNLPEAYNDGRLYLNQGNFSFSDITMTAFPDTTHTSGTWADFNNDGYIDFYSNNSDYYKNNADNTFTKMTGTTAINVTYVADYNDDGKLDALYRGNALWIGNGNFTFTSKACGLPSWGTWGEVFCDINGDGYFDAVEQQNGRTFIYVGNDTFTASTRTNPAIMPDPRYKAGDFDNDGVVEIGADKYYENDGSGTFSAGINAITYSRYSAVGDVDNDGFLDITNIYNSANNSFVAGNGIGQFTQIGSGPTFDGGASYLIDFNNDGKLDIVFARYSTNPPLFYKNKWTSGAYLKIKPQGVMSNKYGIGTKIYIYESGQNFDTAYLRGTRHIGANTNTEYNVAHFGVDPAKTYDVRVYYPATKKTQYRYNATPNQLITIPENAFPSLVINSVSAPNAIPANEITITYTGTDDDGDTMTTANWYYSTDSVTWTAINQNDVTGNAWTASSASGTLKWNVTSFGITKMPTVYFRMRLYDSKDYGSYVAYGPFTVNAVDSSAPQWTPSFKAEDAGYGTDNGWVYKIKLTWSSAVENVGDITYYVQMKVGDKDWEDLKTLINETGYEVTGVNGNVLYKFRIRAKDFYENYTDWYEAEVTCKISTESTQALDITKDNEITFENYDNGKKEITKIKIQKDSAKDKIKSIKVKRIAPNLYDITVYGEGEKAIVHPLFAKPLELVLVYDRENIIAQRFDEKNLGIFCYNDRQEWENLGGDADVPNHTVTTKVNHLSLFKISGISRTNTLDAVPSTGIITPNSDGINDYVEFRIVYPQNASSRDLKMEVYDIQGALRYVNSTSGSATIIWDGKSSDGRLLETGSYIVKLSLEKNAYYSTISICK